MKKQILTLALVAAGIATVGGGTLPDRHFDCLAYKPELIDRCWMWGHDSGVYDGTNNVYNIPVSEPISMCDAIAYMGIPNVCVVRWFPPTKDREYLADFRKAKRFSWVACGDSRWATKYDLAGGCIATMHDCPNMVGMDYDDFFQGGTNVTQECSDGTVEAEAACFTLKEMEGYRDKLAALGRAKRPETRLVLYADGIKPSIKPALDRVDTILFWTWNGKDLGGLEKNVSRLRELAPAKPILLGIYMWDFGGRKPIEMTYMRHQLDVALKLFRAGEIEGLIFHCTPLVNKNLEAVEYCRSWLAQHGHETRGTQADREPSGALRHFGCAYYPEAWDEANWARDLDGMREMGMDIVRIGEFNWGKFEPEEGRFDFAAFHRFLDVCRDKGMKVLMCTPTAAQPKWMQARHPETVRTLKDGSKPVQDLRQTACLTSPKFRFFADRIVTKMAESFRDRPEIVGWQLDNELYSASSGGLCVCDACQKGFRAAMKRRYGTVENMNRALNGAFWSGDFASFDDIVLPFGNRQAWMREMVRFHGEELVSLVHGHRDILRKANPKWRITTNNPCCSGNLRYDTLFGGLDLVSCDHYVSMKGLPRWRWEWTMFRGLSGRQQPFLLGETGAFNYATDSSRTFDSLKPWLWDAIAHGADSVCYFRWRMSVIGEDDHPAILSWSGEKGIACGKIRDMIREMDALPVKFARLEPERTSVAILHDAAAAQFEYARTVNAMVGTAPDVLSMQVHTALERFGVTPEIVQVSQLADLSHYKLVFLPACMTIDADLAAKLAAFVRKGGRVVALTRLACLEPEGGAYPKAAYPVGMTDLFGLEVLDRSGLRTVPQGEFGWFAGCRPTAVKLDFPYGDFTAKGTIEYARTTTAKTLAAYSSTCYAGCPLLTANDVGGGRAYYLTAEPDASGTKCLVRQLLREIGADVSREWPVEVTRVVRGGHTLVVNTSEEEQSVPDEPGELLFGRPPRKLADGRMAIAPYDVLIYRSRP